MKTLNCYFLEIAAFLLILFSAWTFRVGGLNLDFSHFLILFLITALVWGLLYRTPILHPKFRFASNAMYGWRVILGVLLAAIAMGIVSYILPLSGFPRSIPWLFAFGSFVFLPLLSLFLRRKFVTVKTILNP